MAKKVMLRVDPVPKSAKPDLNKIEKGINDNLPTYEKQAKGFFADYLSSALYRKRLIGQGYENPDDAIKLRLANMQVTGLEKKWDKETMYNAPDQKIYINPVTFHENPGLNLKSTVAHEYSHVTGALIPGHPKMPLPMTMNENESHEIEKRNKFRKLSGNQWNKLPLQVKLESLHDINPQETKADLDAVRYLLHSDGIYDAGKQGFDKETLKKVKTKYGSDKIIKRLQDNYSDDDIIWLMNNIAKSEKPKKVMLKVAKNNSELT